MKLINLVAVTLLALPVSFLSGAPVLLAIAAVSSMLCYLLAASAKSSSSVCQGATGILDTQ